MAEKNIAALVREDTYTIKVRFFQEFDNKPLAHEHVTLLGEELRPSRTAYTYVSSIPDIKVNDYVVVYAQGVPKLVIVTEVSTSVEIELNDTKKYSWVVCKVDFGLYMQEMAKNMVIENTVSKAYKNNVRRQFKNMILANLDEASRTQLRSITEKQA